MNPSSLLVTVALFAGAFHVEGAEPTAVEQYMLELINRSRANGNTEAVLYGLGQRQ
jgi:hypothetical protein